MGTFSPSCPLPTHPPRASAVLRNETAVDAVELFDRASLRECEANDDMTRLVPDIKGADSMAAALLIECRGSDEAALKVGMALFGAAG